MPFGAVPNEIWRCVLNKVNENEGCEHKGLGFDAGDEAGERIQQVLEDLLVQIAATKETPLQWHCSQPAALPKSHDQTKILLTG